MIRQIGFLSFLYLITGFCIILLGWMNSDKVLDIAFHDTYFVFSYAFVGTIVGGAFLFCGMVHLLFHLKKKRLISALGWVHFLLTLLSLVAILFLFQKIGEAPSRYEDYSVYEEFKSNGLHAIKRNLIEWTLVVFQLFVLTQLLFVVNVVIGTFLWGRD